MSALPFDTQRAAATLIAFVGTFFIALTVGRFLKRRAGVRLGVLYRLFCLALAAYAALWTYGVALDLRNHVGTALVLLGAAVVVALVDRYVWDLYFEKKKQTPIPHFPRQLAALLLYLVVLLAVLWYGYHAGHWLTGLLATSGIAAILIGLAGQNLLGGIIAGVSLQISRPYKVGDWLQVGERFAELMRQRIRIPYPVRTLHLERRAPRPADDQEEARIILRGDPLFQCLTEEQLDTIVKHSRLDHFGRGERVIEEGAEGDSMFVLLRGAAQVSVAKNGSSIAVATLDSGDCFGEMSLLTGERRSATIRAKGDCYVMEISKPVMAQIIHESPDCLRQLSEILARRRMETEGVLKEAAGSEEDEAKEREYRATFLNRLQHVCSI